MVGGTPMGTGTSPMELEFLAVVTTGTFTEPEVTWWYACNAEEVEWREPTAVRYLMTRMLLRPYTLACTILLVSHFQHIQHIGIVTRFDDICGMSPTLLKLSNLFSQTHLGTFDHTKL